MTIEADFKAKVMQRLKGRCYAQANSDRLRSGIPDHFYSGPQGELWVEYKYNTRNVKGAIKPHISYTQAVWLDGRYEEGCNVAVVVALSLKECLLYTRKQWNFHRERHHTISFDDLIEYILSITGDKASSKNSRRRIGGDTPLANG